MSFQRRASAFDIARRAGARYVGANDMEDDMAYVLSATYSPTLAFSGGGSGAILFGGIGVARVGNARGVPSAGDTVTLFCSLSLSGMTDGETVTVPLPFIASVSANLPRAYAGPGSTFVPVASFADTSNVSIAVGVPGSDSGVVQMEVIYRTLNAIDP